jgi:rhodanese-related sulfurtransferase
MIKFIIGLVIIVCGIIFLPQAYQQFLIWDASNPKDDDSFVNRMLLPLTPSVSPYLVKETIALHTGAVVIDVRTQQEYDEGHIPGAILVPEETLYQKIPQLYPDKTKTIYLYCHTGHRGAVSTRLLKSMGYEKAFNIEGGLDGWQAGGNKIETIYSFPD